ncbi:MAG: hypothetical protein NC222_06295 [Staphylococcus sp.]|nr:hypothetical protein [Staphylococcus sp.]
MIKLEELKQGQEIFYKSVFGWPEKLKIFSIDLNAKEIHLEDGTYLNEKLFEETFLTEKECIEACEKEAKEKLQRLRKMIEKGE